MGDGEDAVDDVDRAAREVEVLCVFLCTCQAGVSDRGRGNE